MNTENALRTRNLIVLILSCLFAIHGITPVLAQSSPASSRNSLRVFLVDAKQLEITRQRIQTGDKSLAGAMAKLEGEAQEALTVPTYSVVTKQMTPPSGNKHDYMSMAPYFWPDPKSPNGLPYIRRDGERNPEINKITDHSTLDHMVSASATLALAYYFKGNEAYATKAAQLLRGWFLDPATRMNPNLEYAQAIPGINTGRGIGLIETRGLTQAVDTIGLLARSKAWTEADQRGVTEWYSTFLQWMLESKNGRDEAAAKNNHGTNYDVQAVSFALFTGRKELAVQILQTSRQKRIATQIEPDGRQPLELVRTKAWSYSILNLDGLMLLATLGETVGVDLWSFQTADGRSIRKALEYLAPFALDGQKWPYQQLGEWPPKMLFPLLHIGAAKFEGQGFRAIGAKLPGVDPSDRTNLMSKIGESVKGELIKVKG